MCQLLGMNCNVPTDICFSFEGFHRRGGATDHHADGWGIAFFEGPGCRLFLDPKPAVESPVAELVRNYPIRSMNVIAHIRKATQGVGRAREHAPVPARAVGPLLDLRAQRHARRLRAAARGLLSAGGHDRQRARVLLHARSLRAALSGRASRRSPRASICCASSRASIAQHGRFNYLLSNGEYLFAHCADKLCYILRHAPFAQAHLIDQDVTVDFSALTTPRRQGRGDRDDTAHR